MKGHKKEKCNTKIYECRILACMFNVRETKLSHKFQVARVCNDGAKIRLVAVKYPYNSSNPLLQKTPTLFYILCITTYYGFKPSKPRKKNQTSGFVLSYP